MGWHHYSILAAIFLWFYSSFVEAYPTPVDYTGSLSRWNVDIDSPYITYEVKAESIYDQAILGASVDEAAGLWNLIPTSYVNLVPAPHNERAMITIEFKAELANASFSAGYAALDEYDDEGYLAHCTISILLRGRLSAIRKTILHELGHCLGLGHTLVPEAIMSYNLEKNSFQLDTDDRAALTRLYPADGSEPSLPPGCSVSSWRGASSLYNHFYLLGLFLLPLFLPTFAQIKRRGS